MFENLSNIDLVSFFQKVLVSCIPLIISVIIHEVSHGAVAYALGDDTAKKAGRFKLHTHFDLYGSFLFPLMLYLFNSPYILGYAKPVPVDPRKFKDPMQDMALVAIAGPLSNIIMAIAVSYFINVSYAHSTDIFHKMCFNFFIINISLFLFNLIPIPPLDGSRIVAPMLPTKLLKIYYMLEPFGFAAILTIEFITDAIFSLFGCNHGILEYILRPPMIAIVEMLLK